MSEENSASPLAISAMMEQSLAFRSSYFRPSLSEPRFISENSPLKVLSKDSFSMYLKPAWRVLSSSPFWVRARLEMLFQRCGGWIT